MSFTYPHIGNVGCNEEDVESSKVYTEGIIVRAAHKTPSNFRATISLPAYLARHGVMGIEGIDTREIVSHLRDNGAQMAVMAGGLDLNPDELVDRAKKLSSMEGRDYVRQVACKEIYTWDAPSWTLKDGNSRRLSQEQLVARPHVVAIDCGIKINILRLLIDVGFRVTVVPAGTTSADIMALRPDGLFLSNGPGDPGTLGYVVKPVQELLGKVPMFGICLGHQLCCRALGLETFKLPFGHRGVNHPVKDLRTGKIEITSQNHGFAVAAPDGGLRVETDEPIRWETDFGAAELSHVNLYDRTVEGLTLLDVPGSTVQYHPEAGPGPHDARHLFDEFVERITKAAA